MAAWRAAHCKLHQVFASKPWPAASLLMKTHVHVCTSGPCLSTRCWRSADQLVPTPIYRYIKVTGPIRPDSVVSCCILYGELCASCIQSVHHKFASKYTQLANVTRWVWAANKNALVNPCEIRQVGIQTYTIKQGR